MSEERTRVLLVEDNPADARLLRELLSESRGRAFDVTVVGTLGAAVSAVVGHHIVLLDLSLPDAHGPEAVSRMARAAGSAPVVVLTGNADDEVALQAVLHGADDYLLKGELSPSLLTRTILYAIERRRGAENQRRLLALEIAGGESIRAAERAKFLSDVTATFARTLDLDEVVQNVTMTVVPFLADHCIAEITTEPGSAAASRAIHERRAVEVNDLAELELDATHREAIAPLDDATALVLPLFARDKVVGTLALISRRDRPLDPEHRALAEEIASRTAIAVDNATLYRAKEQAVRARDELLAVVSHDLRNPLSVFGLTLQTVRRAAETSRPPNLAMIERGTRALVRMERLIGDLLDVARIDAGTFDVTKSRFDLGALLREATEQNIGLAAEKGIALHNGAAAHLPAEGDRDRLMQVLANLIGNAIKFTPRGGSITVASSMRASSLVVSVEDTGPGIPEENLRHVFDRFVQMDRRAGGLGLGLAIAKGIVNAHGGTIGVESVPGRGARFWFELPTTPALAEISP